MAQEDENERGRKSDMRVRFRPDAKPVRQSERQSGRSMRLLIAVDAVLLLAILIARRHAALPEPEPGTGAASF